MSEEEISEEEENDFFFHDIPIVDEDEDEDSPPHQLDNMRFQGTTSTGATHTSSSHSAPTLRKYTSRDNKCGFQSKSGVLSFLSLTPSLSHPAATPEKRYHSSLGVVDFFGTNSPPNNIAFSELDDMQRVAIGRNSLIYKAIYRSKPVAVKVMMVSETESLQLVTIVNPINHTIMFKSVLS